MQLLHWEHSRAEVSAAQGTADGHGRNVVAGQGPGKPNRNSRTLHGARGRRNNIHQSQRWQPKHTRSVTRLSRQSWRSATAGKQEQASANHPSASCHVRCYSITSMCCLLVDTAAIIRLTGLKCSSGLRQNRNGADEQTCCNEAVCSDVTRPVSSGARATTGKRGQGLREYSGPHAQALRQKQPCFTCLHLFLPPFVVRAAPAIHSVSKIGREFMS